jgi:eukaryotic-like serine/threonine-protein kinase
MNEPSKTPTPSRYRAFICYSQQDRAAAEKLHRHLENYRVPRRLVGRTGRLGAIPERLSPVFRDRDELAASSNIGERLHEALTRSDFLVVLCSPASAQSRWVNAEITSFYAVDQRNHSRTIAVMLAGDPSSADQAANCFPPALRSEENSVRGMGPAFPLAADLRPGRDRRRDAELRLIAALIGAEFDELKQRHEDRRVRQLRGWLTLSAAVALAFAGVTLFALHQRQQAEQSAARAAVARNEAEKLVDFMLFDLRPKLEAIGKSSLLEPANEKVLAYYQTVEPREDNPDILRRRAAALHQRAVDLYNHGDAATTMDMLLAAAAMRQRLIEFRPQDPDAYLSLADTRRVLANQRQDAGDAQGALREIGLAIAEIEQAVRIQPNNYHAAVRLASIHTEEAETLIRTGKTPEAAARLEASLGTLEKLLASHSDDLELKDRTAAAAWKLGVACRRMSDFERAEKSFLRSVALAEELQESDPSSIQYSRRHQLSLSSLGTMLIEAGRTEEALNIIKRSLEAARKIVARDPSNRIYVATLATTLSQITAALGNSDRYQEALPYCREEVDLLDKFVAQGFADARTRWTLAMALSTYGAALSATGSPSEAVTAQRRSIEVQHEVSSHDPSDLKMLDDLGYLHSRLGFTLSAAKAYHDAEAEFRTAISTMDEILAKDPGNPQLVRKGEKAEWQLGLGIALKGKGATKEARQVLSDCISGIDSAVSAGLPATAQADTRKSAQAELAAMPPP